MTKLSSLIIVLFGFRVIASSQTVSIGSQVWMIKNLDKITFRNGDPIPQAKTNDEWKMAGENKQPAWCYYDNDAANGDRYGKLYNWYAVNDPRGLAPVGFHIPTPDEWTVLTDFLGEDEGKIMKASSGWSSYTLENTCLNCAHWNEEYRSKVPCHVCRDTRKVPSEPISGNGSDSSGFLGFPGGIRYEAGDFSDIGKVGNWWSIAKAGSENAWYRDLALVFSLDWVDRYTNSNGSGLSVRCVKD